MQVEIPADEEAKLRLSGVQVDALARFLSRRPWPDQAHLRLTVTYGMVRWDWTRKDGKCASHCVGLALVALLSADADAHRLEELCRLMLRTVRRRQADPDWVEKSEYVPGLAPTRHHEEGWT